jgi:hypothetical protein
MDEIEFGTCGLLDKSSNCDGTPVAYTSFVPSTFQRQAESAKAIHAVMQADRIKENIEKALRSDGQDMIPISQQNPAMYTSVAQQVNPQRVGQWQRDQKYVPTHVFWKDGSILSPILHSPCFFVSSNLRIVTTLRRTDQLWLQCYLRNCPTSKMNSKSFSPAHASFPERTWHTIPH